MTLDRLWAGWRSAYVNDPRAGLDAGECLLCGLAGADDDAEALVVARTPSSFVVMNLYPYVSGHMMVSPVRHEANLEGLDDAEAVDVMRQVQIAVRAAKEAFGADGVNVGANLGEAAGAGVPDHVHVHVLPRWKGDTNFMTSVAEVRVLPEDIRTSYRKLRAAWPAT